MPTLPQTYTGFETIVLASPAGGALRAEPPPMTAAQAAMGFAVARGRIEAELDDALGEANYEDFETDSYDTSIEVLGVRQDLAIPQQLLEWMRDENFLRAWFVYQSHEVYVTLYPEITVHERKELADQERAKERERRRSRLKLLTLQLERSERLALEERVAHAAEVKRLQLQIADMQDSIRDSINSVNDLLRPHLA